MCQYYISSMTRTEPLEKIITILFKIMHMDAKKGAKSIRKELASKFKDLSLSLDYFTADDGILVLLLQSRVHKYRDEIFSFFLQKYPNMNLALARMSASLEEKCFLQLIVESNDFSLWEVIKKQNLKIPYQIVMKCMESVFNENMHYQILQHFDLQNPSFDYNETVQSDSMEIPCTLMYPAAFYGYKQIFDFLVEKGCSVFRCCSTISDQNPTVDKSPFSLAIQRALYHEYKNRNQCGHEEKNHDYLYIIEKILERIVQSDQCDELKKEHLSLQMPLISVIQQSDLHFIQKMTEFIKKYDSIGTTINSCNITGNSPLMMAAELYRAYKDQAYLDIFQFLIEEGADLYICNNMGYSVFFILTQEFPSESIDLLFDKALSYPDANRYFAEPLSVVVTAEEKNLELVMLKGQTIAHHAAYLGHKRTLQKLLSDNFNFCIHDCLGRTPFFLYLMYNGDLDTNLMKQIVDSMLQQGHNIFSDINLVPIESDHYDELKLYWGDLNQINIFEMAIFAQEADFSIYLIEKGALKAQKDLSCSFFQIIEKKFKKNLAESHEAQKSFFDDLLQPLWTYFVNNPQYHDDLKSYDACALKNLIILYGLHLFPKNFIRALYPDWADPRSPNSIYRAVLDNALRENNQVSNDNLFCPDYFTSDQLFCLWQDRSDRIFLEKLMQEIKTQMHTLSDVQSRSPKEADSSLKNYAFMANFIASCFVHIDKEKIEFLQYILNSDICDNFFPQPNAVRFVLNCIQGVYRTSPIETQKILINDLDNLYLAVFVNAVKKKIPFDFCLEDLNLNAKTWIDRCLERKTLTLNLLAAFLENTSKVPITFLPTDFFKDLYQKLNSFFSGNTECERKFLAELELFLKRMEQPLSQEEANSIITEIRNAQDQLMMFKNYQSRLMSYQSDLMAEEAPKKIAFLNNAMNTILEKIQHILERASAEHLKYHPKLQYSLLADLISTDGLEKSIEYLLSQKSYLDITSIDVTDVPHLNVLHYLVHNQSCFTRLWPIFERHCFLMTKTKMLSILNVYTCNEEMPLKIFQYFMNQNKNASFSEKIFDPLMQESFMPAFIAAKNAYPNILKILLETGSSLIDVDHKNTTSSVFDEICSMEIFLRNTVDINTLIPAYLQSIDVVFNYLRDLKQKSQTSEPLATTVFYREGSTPLHAAARQKESKIFLKMLDAVEMAFKEKLIECDINTPNTYGQTSLHLALDEGYDKSVIEILISRGASLHARDVLNRHAFFYSTDVEIAKMIYVQVKSQLQTEEFQQWMNIPLALHPVEQLCSFKYYLEDSQSTVLHKAVLLGSYELVEQCIDDGANLAAINGQGCTPFDLAIITPGCSMEMQNLLYTRMRNAKIEIYHHIEQTDEIVRVMRDKNDGALYSIEYLHFKTLLQICLERQMEKELNFLVDHGALDKEIDAHNPTSPFIYFLECAARYQEIDYSDFYPKIATVIWNLPRYTELLLGLSSLHDTDSFVYCALEQEEFLLLYYIFENKDHQKIFFERSSFELIEKYAFSVMSAIHRTVGSEECDYILQAHCEIFARHLELIFSKQINDKTVVLLCWIEKILNLPWEYQSTMLEAIKTLSFIESIGSDIGHGIRFLNMIVSRASQSEESQIAWFSVLQESIPQQQQMPMLDKWDAQKDFALLFQAISQEQKVGRGSDAILKLYCEIFIKRLVSMMQSEHNTSNSEQKLQWIEKIFEFPSKYQNDITQIIEKSCFLDSISENIKDSINLLSMIAESMKVKSEEAQKSWLSALRISLTKQKDALITNQFDLQSDFNLLSDTISKLQEADQIYDPLVKLHCEIFIKRLVSTIQSENSIENTEQKIAWIQNILTFPKRYQRRLSELVHESRFFDSIFTDTQDSIRVLNLIVRPIEETSQVRKRSWLPLFFNAIKNQVVSVPNNWNPETDFDILCKLISTRQSDDNSKTYELILQCYFNIFTKRLEAYSRKDSTDVHFFWIEKILRLPSQYQSDIAHRLNISDCMQNFSFIDRISKYMNHGIVLLNMVAKSSATQSEESQKAWLSVLHDSLKKQKDVILTDQSDLQADFNLLCDTISKLQAADQIYDSLLKLYCEIFTKCLVRMIQFENDTSHSAQKLAWIEKILQFPSKYQYDVAKVIEKSCFADSIFVNIKDGIELLSMIVGSMEVKSEESQKAWLSVLHDSLKKQKDVILTDQSDLQADFNLLCDTISKMQAADQVYDPILKLHCEIFIQRLVSTMQPESSIDHTEQKIAWIKNILTFPAQYQSDIAQLVATYSFLDSISLNMNDTIRLLMMIITTLEDDPEEYAKAWISIVCVSMKKHTESALYTRNEKLDDFDSWIRIIKKLISLKFSHGDISLFTIQPEASFTDQQIADMSFLSEYAKEYPSLMKVWSSQLLQKAAQSLPHHLADLFNPEENFLTSFKQKFNLNFSDDEILMIFLSQITEIKDDSSALLEKIKSFLNDKNRKCFSRFEKFFDVTKINALRNRINKFSPQGTNPPATFASQADILDSNEILILDDMRNTFNSQLFENDADHASSKDCDHKESHTVATNDPNERDGHFDNAENVKKESDYLSVQSTVHRLKIETLEEHRKCALENLIEAVVGEEDIYSMLYRMQFLQKEVDHSISHMTVKPGSDAETIACLDIDDPGYDLSSHIATEPKSEEPSMTSYNVSEALDKWIENLIVSVFRDNDTILSHLNKIEQMHKKLLTWMQEQSDITPSFQRNAVQKLNNRIQRKKNKSKKEIFKDILSVLKPYIKDIASAKNMYSILCRIQIIQKQMENYPLQDNRNSGTMIQPDVDALSVDVIAQIAIQSNIDPVIDDYTQKAYTALNVFLSDIVKGDDSIWIKQKIQLMHNYLKESMELDRQMMKKIKEGALFKLGNAIERENQTNQHTAKNTQKEPDNLRVQLSPYNLSAEMLEDYRKYALQNLIEAVVGKDDIYSMLYRMEFLKKEVDHSIYNMTIKQVRYSKTIARLDIDDPYYDLISHIVIEPNSAGPSMTSYNVSKALDKWIGNLIASVFRDNSGLLSHLNKIGLMHKKLENCMMKQSETMSALGQYAQGQLALGMLQKNPRSQKDIDTNERHIFTSCMKYITSAESMHSMLYRIELMKKQMDNYILQENRSSGTIIRLDVDTTSADVISQITIQPNSDPVFYDYSVQTALSAFISDLVSGDSSTWIKQKIELMYEHVGLSIASASHMMEKIRENALLKLSNAITGETQTNRYADALKCQKPFIFNQMQNFQNKQNSIAHTQNQKVPSSKA